MEEIKIGLFGSLGVGKSSLCVRYVQDIFVEKYDPNIEDSYRKVAEIDRKSYLLEILDTSGHLNLSNFVQLYIRDIQSFLFLFAINSRKSFDETARFLFSVKEQRAGTKFPCTLVGTKSDLDNECQIPKEEAEELAEAFNCHYFETSSRLNQNLSVVFEYAVTQALNDMPLNSREKKEKTCFLM